MATSLIPRGRRGAHVSVSATASGFSLLELLIAALLVVTAVVASLHSLQTGYATYRVSSDSRKATVDLWNQSRRARHGAIRGSQTRIFPQPGARPLYRSLIRSAKGGPKELEWEVLRAEK